MAWTGHPRTTTAAWRNTRRRILDRDGHRCYLCRRPATEVDHLTPIAEHGSELDSNLAAICHACHARKSSAEGNRAQARRRASRLRPPERHPGQL